MNQSVCALAPCGITTATLRAVISVVWRCARWREVVWLVVEMHMERSGLLLLDNLSQALLFWTTLVFGPMGFLCLGRLLTLFVLVARQPFDPFRPCPSAAF
jgi:hypothetical protein